ncbi:PGF-CTERM protein [Halolamina pelagica]|uniref:PGF-CTERM protein n=3 Tax=Haloferacaceae TaxID=1644056 RepID=A0A1I5VTN1_9EURY|nr:PGF-CTERM protein [Halolamina pelagica]
MIMSVFVAGIGFTGAVAADGHITADRSIDSVELAPGESTTVDITVERNESGGIQIVDDFDDSLDVEIIDGLGSLDNVANGEVTFNSPTGADADLTVTYEVTVPEDAAAGTEYTFDGFVQTDSQYDISGDSTITVVESGDTPTATPEPTPTPEPPADDTPEETSNGAIVFSGQDVVFDTAGDAGSDQYVLRSGSPDDSNTAERTLSVQENGLIVIDTGGLDTGSYYITNDGADSADLSFDVIDQDFSASFGADEVGNIGAAGDTTINFGSDNRGSDFDVVVTSDDLDDDEVADIFGVEDTDVDGDGAAAGDGVVVENVGDGTEYGVSLADVDAGNYTFDFAVADTDASASADIEVSDTSEGAASFEHSGSLNVPQGNVAEITVDLTGAASSGTLVIGDEQQDGYQANVSFTDGDDDGQVTVLFNTYLAGNADADDSAIVSAAGEDDSATLTGESELSAIAAQGDYTLAVSTSGSAADVIDSPQELSTLFIGDRSTDGMTMWTAPGNAALDANDDGAVTADDVSTLVDDGVVTEDSTITMGDYAIHEISATGLEGVIDADGGFADAIESGSLTLTVEQTNQIQNQDPKTLNVTNSLNAIDVINGDGTYYVLVDLENADFERNGDDVDLADGDEFDATFTVADDRLLGSTSADDHQSVSTTFTVESMSTMFDSEPVQVAAADGQTVTGQTNLAPGTELTVRVRSQDTQPGFYDTQTVTVGADGTFTATFDFSEQSTGDKFTASVRATGSTIAQADGEVVEQVGTATATPEPTETATATPEPTETATPEPTATDAPETDEPTETPEDDTTTTTTPGFGVAVALVALLAAALLAGRRE